jgi:hypothetical protein
MHEARREFPWLESIELQVGQVVALPGLESCVAKEGTEKVVEGCSVLLANLLDLLVTFIGDDLTARVLRRAWPDGLGEDGGFAGPEEDPNDA